MTGTEGEASLAARRDARGMTQTALAARFGCHKSTICRLEQGQGGTFAVRRVYALASAYGLRTDLALFLRLSGLDRWIPPALQEGLEP
ncbi:MAG TPA: helix-turn-helix transcriptional regulator [Thermoanaerobaculia bacterium]|nr:helix-turn-helix transcriptional regulator [Thermoanaerobaculia bacterium]